MDQIEFRYAELDGKRIAYHSQSVFLVQLGKGKSSYRTKWSFTGNLAQAVMWYRGLNVGYGHKKRLVCWSLNKPVLARMTTN